MNRVDRLFAITLLLQARRKIRARDLAEKFEINERTIYRDMAALSESGVPIVGTPGEGCRALSECAFPDRQCHRARAQRCAGGFDCARKMALS